MKLIRCKWEMDTPGFTFYHLLSLVVRPVGQIVMGNTTNTI